MDKCEHPERELLPVYQAGEIVKWVCRNCAYFVIKCDICAKLFTTQEKMLFLDDSSESGGYNVCPKCYEEHYEKID